MAENWEQVWREQGGGPAVDIRVLERRESELSRRTRAEILASFGAAALFLAVVGWRFATAYGRVPTAGLVAMAAWLLVSLVWFFGRRRGQRAPDSVTASGVEHYRRELERRRDHLRNVWIWHGPLIAACVTLAVVVDSPLAMRRIGAIAPLLVVLAAWVVFGAAQRRREARGLQREIDELGEE